MTAKIKTKKCIALYYLPIATKLNNFKAHAQGVSGVKYNVSPSNDRANGRTLFL